MSVTFTQLAAATADSSNANSYTGNTGTPNAGDLLVCFVYATATVDAGSMSGTWTWTLLTSFAFSGNTMYVFWAYASNATSTTPVFNCPTDAATGCCIYCLRVTGSEGVQVPSIRQTGSATGITTNPSLTLTSKILSSNGVAGFVVNGTNSSTQFTAPSGWTENAEVTYINPSTGFEVASIASGETNSTISWTNSNTTRWGIVLLEFWIPRFRSASGGMAGSSPMFY